MSSSEPHPYTVDVILHGVEPYPCVICGGWRQAPLHHANARSAACVEAAVASLLDESHSTLFGRSYDLSNPSSRQQAIDWLTGLIIEVEERL